jgi:murein DD-endopeptidase MepM/ murein hydrolase activator NlpD
LKKISRKGIAIIVAAVVAALLFVLLMFPGIRGKSLPESDTTIDTPAVQIVYGLDVTGCHIVDSFIPERAYFGGLMASVGVPGHDIHEMVTLADSVFDLRRIRAGNKCAYIFHNEDEAMLRWFVYHIDIVNYVVFDFGSPKSVFRGAKDVDTISHEYSGIISSSLWNAMVEDGKNPGLILDLSDIFAWTIDFYGIQKGDRFKVVYDELLVDDKSIGIGTIHAAWFEHVGKEYYAFRYFQDSMMQYFDTAGVSLRREFLKAPLEFRRISSHFSHSRLHPILRRYRPHHGVDYAAPAGTPVRAIGSGTVIEAKYAGGAGKMVKIRHNSVYTTVSMHLRGFAPGIKNGARVQQGQVIGYVGSTGLSTGPHLDFRVYKNGSPINPLKLESPPAKPVDPANIEQYKQAIKDLKKELDRMKKREL